MILSQAKPFFSKGLTSAASSSGCENEKEHELEKSAARRKLAKNTNDYSHSTPLTIFATAFGYRQGHNFFRTSRVNTDCID